MAGWGTGSFENEHAQKWLGQLSSLRIDDLQKIFASAVEADYLEAPDASVIIAAAEVLAAANAMPNLHVPNEISAWVGPNPAPPNPELLRLSLQAISKVRSNSELRDLWLQADGLNEWTAAIRDLERRLSHK